MFFLQKDTSEMFHLVFSQKTRTRTKNFHQKDVGFAPNVIILITRLLRKSLWFLIHLEVQNLFLSDNWVDVFYESLDKKVHASRRGVDTKISFFSFMCQVPDCPKFPKKVNTFDLRRFSNSNFSQTTALTSSSKVSSKRLNFVLQRSISKSLIQINASEP